MLHINWTFILIWHVKTGLGNEFFKELLKPWETTPGNSVEQIQSNGVHHINTKNRIFITERARVLMFQSFRIHQRFVRGGQAIFHGFIAILSDIFGLKRLFPFGGKLVFLFIRRYYSSEKKIKIGSWR